MYIMDFYMYLKKTELILILVMTLLSCKSSDSSPEVLGGVSGEKECSVIPIMVKDLNENGVELCSAVVVSDSTLLTSSECLSKKNFVETI